MGKGVFFLLRLILGLLLDMYLRIDLFLFAELGFFLEGFGGGEYKDK